MQEQRSTGSSRSVLRCEMCGGDAAGVDEHGWTWCDICLLEHYAQEVARAEQAAEHLAATVDATLGALDPASIRQVVESVITSARFPRDETGVWPASANELERRRYRQKQRVCPGA